VSAARRGSGSIWRLTAKSGAGLYQYSPSRNQALASRSACRRAALIQSLSNSCRSSPTKSKFADRVKGGLSNRCLPIISSDDPINIGRPRHFSFRLTGSRYGCTDTAPARAWPRRQRFVSPFRRLGGLRSSGGRLIASPMLSASPGADLAGIEFLAGDCTDTAHLPSLIIRRCASTLRQFDSFRRPGGRPGDSPTLFASAGIDLADFFSYFLFHGGGAVLIQPSFMRLYQASRRFASTLRQSGCLSRPGGGLAAALMLSESAVVDLAVGGSFWPPPRLAAKSEGGLYQYSPPPNPTSRGGWY